MTGLHVAGLDLSMVSTGWTKTNPGGLPGEAITGTVKTKDSAGDARLLAIADEINFQLAKIFPVEFVLIEGFLNKSFTAGITGMVHGAVRAMLIERRYRYGTMPPSSLKKLATGSGAATKTDMRLAAYKRAGVEFAKGKPGDDECDSWWLWVAANLWLGQSIGFTIPAIQRDQLKNIVMETK